MKVIVAAQSVLFRGRRLDQDCLVDVPDDEAARLIAGGDWLAESDAPVVMITSSCSICGETFSPGERISISPESARAIPHRGEGILLGRPPVPKDTDFPTLPLNWAGGELSATVELALSDPILQASDGTPTIYAPKKISLHVPFLLSDLTLPSWQSTFSTPPSGSAQRIQTRHGSGSIEIPARRMREYHPSPTVTDHQAARQRALDWWRRHRLFRLLVEILDRLRRGLWQADGFIVREGVPRREPILPAIWRDGSMMVNFLGKELTPSKNAPPGLPWYRDIELRPARYVQLLNTEGDQVEPTARNIEASQPETFDLSQAIVHFAPRELRTRSREAPDCHALAVAVEDMSRSLLGRCRRGEVEASGVHFPITPNSNRIRFEATVLQRFVLDLDTETLRSATTGVPESVYGQLQFSLAMPRLQAEQQVLSSEAETKPTPNHRKRSDKTVRAWYRARVKSWPIKEPPPSEEMDWSAARTEFGPELTRDELRIVRGALAPDAWRKPGRRPKRNSRT